MTFAQKNRMPSFARGVLLAGLVLLIGGSGVRADLILSFQPDPVPVVQGSTGNFFTIQATNSGPNLMLDSFNVTVSVPAMSGITFTGGDDMVMDYVFAGNSLGFLFANPMGPNTADISDVADMGPQSIASSATVNLGRIFFNVAADAPIGLASITLEPSTSFTNGDLQPVDFFLSEGSVNPGILVSPIPEPATMALFAAGGIAFFGVRRAQRKQKAGQC